MTKNQVLFANYIMPLSTAKRKTLNFRSMTADCKSQKLKIFLYLPVICNSLFSAACKTAEKFTPARSASKFNQEGIDAYSSINFPQHQKTALLESSSSESGFLAGFSF